MSEILTKSDYEYLKMYHEAQVRRLEVLLESAGASVEFAQKSIEQLTEDENE